MTSCAVPSTVSLIGLASKPPEPQVTPKQPSTLKTKRMQQSRTNQGHPHTTHRLTQTRTQTCTQTHTDTHKPRATRASVGHRCSQGVPSAPWSPCQAFLRCTCHLCSTCGTRDVSMYTNVSGGHSIGCAALTISLTGQQYITIGRGEDQRT